MEIIPKTKGGSRGTDLDVGGEIEAVLGLFTVLLPMTLSHLRPIEIHVKGDHAENDHIEADVPPHGAPVTIKEGEVGRERPELVEVMVPLIREEDRKAVNPGQDGNQR